MQLQAVSRTLSKFKHFSNLEKNLLKFKDFKHPYEPCVRDRYCYLKSINFNGWIQIGQPEHAFTQRIDNLTGVTVE